MGEPRPQPTAVLIRRLRRVAKFLDKLAADVGTSDPTMRGIAVRARANTCWQAAARLQLLTDPDAECCEGCPNVATTEDNAGVPLCDDCYAALDSRL